MSSQNICTICQEVFLFQVENKDEQPFALKCGHVFHKKCLTQWTANVNKCPQCRATAQNPIRLFFISDSDTHREELDLFALQSSLNNEKNNNLSLKRKYDEARKSLELSKELCMKLQLRNDELEQFVPSLKDCVSTLRKEIKSSSETVARLKKELNAKQQELQTLENVKEILDESVESVAVEKYKNMKADMVAAIVNQWKRNAQYYKQREISDKNKYLQTQENLKASKQETMEFKNELQKLKEEVRVLRHKVNRNPTSSPDTSPGLFLNGTDELMSDDEINRPTLEMKSGNLKRPKSPVNVSPLVKKMKVTNTLALKSRSALCTLDTSNRDKLDNHKLPSSSQASKYSLSTSQSKPIFKNSSKLLMSSRPISMNSKTNVFTTGTETAPPSILKKAKSFKSTLDIFKHFDP